MLLVRRQSSGNNGPSIQLEGGGGGGELSVSKFDGKKFSNFLSANLMERNFLSLTHPTPFKLNRWSLTMTFNTFAPTDRVSSIQNNE